MLSTVIMRLSPDQGFVSADRLTLSGGETSNRLHLAAAEPPCPCESTTLMPGTGMTRLTLYNRPRRYER